MLSTLLENNVSVTPTNVLLYSNRSTRDSTLRHGWTAHRLDPDRGVLHQPYFATYPWTDDLLDSIE